MTSQKSFRRSTTRRLASRSAHDLTRRFSFKPQLEYLETRLAPAGGALSLTVNTVTTPVTTVYGQAVTFAGSATGLSNPNTNNADTIQINDSVAGTLTSTPLSVATTTSTTGSFSKSTSTINHGTYSVFAHDNTDGAVTDSASVSLTVNPTNSKTTITHSGPTVVGQPNTYTATVVALAPGTGSPADGTVLFSLDSGATTSTQTIGANGKAIDVVTWATTGPHTVDATYNGDDTAGNFNGSTATQLPVTVTGALAPTTVVSFQGTIKLAAAFAPLPSTISVNPLFGDLSSGTTISFGGGAVALRTTAAATQGATSVSVTPLTNGGEPANTVSDPLQFAGGSSVYAQPNVIITATVSSGANHPTTGGVLWSDVINTNIGSVTLAAGPGAAAHATTLSVLALPGGLTAGERFRFKFGSPSVTVDATATGNVLVTSKVTLSQATLATDTSLHVQPLNQTLLGSETLTFSGHPVTLTGGPYAFGATVLNVAGTVGAAIANGTTTSTPAHATSITVQALAEPLALGTKVTFNPGGAVVVVTLTSAALAGDTTLHVSDIGASPIAGGIASAPTDIIVTTAATAAGANVLHVNPLPKALAPGQFLTFGGVQTHVENAVSTSSTPTGSTNIITQPLTQSYGVGSQLKFGNVVVTLTKAASVGQHQIFFNADSGAIHIGDTYTPAPGDTTVYGTPLNAALSTGTGSNAANPGDTTITVAEIGATAIPGGAVASTDTSNNPLFMGGAKTTISPVGFTEVTGAAGRATLNESLLGSPALTLPGAITAYTATGLVATFSPVSHFFVAQYFDGALGGPSDPNYQPGPASVPAQGGREVIFRTPTVTQIAVTPGPTAQFGQTVTITATVTSSGGGFLMPPIGTVTFVDNYTTGGVTNNITMGTVTLPTLFQISTLTRSGTTATATVPLGTAGLVNNELVGITGAKDSHYNGAVIITVTGPTTFTYTVSASAATPDGGSSITAAVIGTQPFLPLITSAKATFTTSTLVGGNPTSQNHVLRAVYNGDNTAPFPLQTAFPFRGQWVNSVSGGFGEHIQQDSTTGTLSANPTNNSPFGSAVTFVDTIHSTSGGSVHGGTVVFKDGTTVLGTGSVNIHGVATLLVSSLSVPGNPHTVTAVYNGSQNFANDTSNALTYTITPGATTTTVTVPQVPGGHTLTLTSLASVGTTVTGTVSGGIGFTGSIPVTIAGATPTGYNGVFVATMATSTTFTYTDLNVGTGTATGTITAATASRTTITINQAFNLKATVAGAPGFIPTGTVKFVAESNNRDAVAGSGIFFTPFTLGTATLAGGIASLAVPASGAGSLASLTIAAGNGQAADVYELEAFYSGDANYAVGHSTTVAPHGGPVANELAIADTGVGFFKAVALGFGIVSTSAPHNGVTVLGRIRDSAENGLGPPAAGNNSILPATGGVGGHYKVFVDGVQFTTQGGKPSTPQIASESGTFSKIKTGVATAGQHTLVMQYLGDGLDGFLQPGSTTIVFTEASVAGSNALASPKGSVAFSTAPKSTSGTTSTTTSSTTTSGTSGGLSSHGVDDFFSSTTTHQTARTLAGALGKAHSGDDWLTGPF